MVAARPGAPSPADPRVACPACGGLIHPIAGRCKHCKTDLTAMRGPALAPPPAAAMAPRQLAGAPIPPPIAAYAPQPANVGPVTNWAARPLGPAPAANGYNGHGNGALHPLAPPGGGSFLPTSAASSGQVATAAQLARNSAWSRRWPIIVVILAAAAIAVSIYLLVKGNEQKSSKVKRSTVPTMDDGMNTNPLTGGGQGGATPDPWGQAPSLPPPPDDDDQIEDDDILGGGGGGGNPFAAPATAPPRDKFFQSMYSTVVERLETCGAPKDTVDSLRTVLGSLDIDSSMGSLCREYDTVKAGACIKKLRDFPCVGMGSWDSTQVYSMFSSFTECSEACRP
jgi:hypothetical protein